MGEEGRWGCVSPPDLSHLTAEVGEEGSMPGRAIWTWQWQGPWGQACAGWVGSSLEPCPRWGFRMGRELPGIYLNQGLDGKVYLCLSHTYLCPGKGAGWRPSWGGALGPSPEEAWWQGRGHQEPWSGPGWALPW